MRLITIVNRYGVITAHEGLLKGAKEEWVAPGLKVFKKGHYGRKDYESACNLALNIAIDMHIPAISLRKVSR